VAAMELPTKRRKRHFYTEEQKVNEKEMSLPPSFPKGTGHDGLKHSGSDGEWDRENEKNVLRECNKKMWIDEHGEAIDSHQQGEVEHSLLDSPAVGRGWTASGTRASVGIADRPDPVEGTGTMSAMVWARSEEAFGSPDRNSDGLRSTRVTLHKDVETEKPRFARNQLEMSGFGRQLSSRLQRWTMGVTAT
ncbi:hypothetical protein TELCIR_16049, partial [Teladorsagia circumcincta]